MSELDDVAEPCDAQRKAELGSSIAVFRRIGRVLTTWLRQLHLKFERAVPRIRRGDQSRAVNAGNLANSCGWRDGEFR